jgi:predicted nucleotidyltransferase
MQLQLQLLAKYGNRLKQVRLFGSYARGEADDESDLDVLIILDRIDHYCGEVDRTGQLIADLSLEYGVSISRVFVSESEWRVGQSVFLRNVRAEAIPA